MATIYASIGNSDDKLTQARWSEFADLFVTTIRAHAPRIHGVWYSLPDSRYQNACVCFEIEVATPLRLELTRLAAEYDQDSIAWAQAPATEFLGADDGLGT